MTTTITVGGDGRIVVDAATTREIGLQPGDTVRMEQDAHRLVLTPKPDLHAVFERWRGFNKSRAPRSIDEIVAEIRKMRGHDDVD